MSIDLLIIRGKGYTLNLFCAGDVILHGFTEQDVFNLTIPARLGQLVSDPHDTFSRLEKFTGGMCVGMYDPKYETDFLQENPQHIIYLGKIVEVQPGDELYKIHRKKTELNQFLTKPF